MAKTWRLLLFQARRTSVLFQSPRFLLSCWVRGMPELVHTENPHALTDPPAVVLVFVAKHGLVDLDRFSSAAQLQVMIHDEMS